MAPEWGSTVWSGTSLDCPNSNNEIIFLYNRFLFNGTDGESGVCNNGSIVAQIFGVDAAGTTLNYTSQLNLTIRSNNIILGQNIACSYDDNLGRLVTVGSIKLNQQGNTTLTMSFKKLANCNYVTAQFSPSNISYSVANSGSQKTIIFNWVPFNISTCQAIPYNIIASNCGICPTTTNHTTVTCTDMPIDATNCHFALIPTICGRVSPSLSISLDVELIMKGLYCVIYIIGMHLLQY